MKLSTMTTSLHGITASPPFYYKGSLYPLIPPVTPPIIFSDKKRYRIKVGRNTITTAANIPAQLPVYCIDWSIPYSPTATGRNVSLFAKINDRKYSFQILIKLKIVTVTIPD